MPEFGGVEFMRLNRTRRAFLESLGVFGATLAAPTRFLSASNATQRLYGLRRDTHIDESDFKVLAGIAIDAAQNAGATYVDVRMTRTNQLQFSSQAERQTEEFYIGIRVLANGAWGFASHINSDRDTMHWLGTTSVALAKANAWAGVPPIEMAKIPVVTGTWHTSAKIDPFVVSREELDEPIQKFVDSVKQAGAKECVFQLNCERQDRSFASSEGSLTHQRIYTAMNTQVGSRFFSPASSIRLQTQDDVLAPILPVSPLGAGWEAIAAYTEYIPDALAYAAQIQSAKSLDQPGRYEVVFDGAAMAALVSVVGRATEADRAVGLDGSDLSFLGPMRDQLGKQVLPTSVTITADRSMVGGAGTVGWDDEGVAPSTYPVISSGIFMHYATGREIIPEMQEFSAKRAIALAGVGCMASDGAKFMPIVSTPNLTLAPDSNDTSFTDLLSGITHGFAVVGGSVNMDSKLLTGWGTSPMIYTVRNGQLAEPVRKVAYSFNMLDHWKNLIALGGPKSVMTQGFNVIKGAPNQRFVHSVRACAARFKDVAIRPLGLSRAV